VNIVNLITSKNEQLRQPLHNEGFVVNEFSPSTDNNNLEEKIIKGKTNYTLLEISDFENSGSTILAGRIKLLYDKSKLICFSSDMTPDLRKFLLKTGISDCITDFSPDRIASYIKNLNIMPETRPGTFVILDDNELQKNMFNSIIKRFGYKTRFVSTTEELFEIAAEPENLMILLNIGTAGLDLNDLVRRSYINSDIKKNPVIAYKCMDQGLFVHEIINGLSRLTKVILSPEEIYCMLTDMLFKKEITSFTNSYISSLKYEKIHTYAGKTIQQIYYENQGDPCGQESLFDKERIDSMIDSSEMIRRTLIRAEGIIWLRHTESALNRPTCGAGA
jgi:hypothetical protein